MLPDPLHPAVVHFPMALAVLVPILALLGFIAVHAGLLPARSWAVVVLVQALLVGSAWLALETGEEDEERVERVVAERHIEAHEEAAERFMLMAGVTLLLSAGGLLPGGGGRFGRAATLVASFGLLVAGVRVGHLGGELVYRHGAASAHVERAQKTAAGEAARGTRSAHDEHDDDD